MKNQRKSLSLKRETLRALEAHQIAAVHGGQVIRLPLPTLPPDCCISLGCSYGTKCLPEM